MRTIWSRVGVMAAVLAAVVAAGCQRTPRVPVELQGLPLRPDLGTDIEVVNWNGTVRVEAGPRHSTPEVRARVRRLTRQGPEGSELREAVNVEAVSLIENGRRLVRVRGVPTGTAREEEVALDLIVRVARADDVRISNSGGPVFVSGWSGGLVIDTARAAEPAGMSRPRPVRESASRSRSPQAGAR
ncbi:hypothetical protein J4558_06960 [Leptolyngbya sp. 15MV]|nr:hypothetical protein J4558_06960 [Leptolyngbya sp. 15MV]